MDKKITKIRRKNTNLKQSNRIEKIKQDRLNTSLSRTRNFTKRSLGKEQLNSKKPMPSLAELEKMYDSEETLTIVEPVQIVFTCNQRPDMCSEIMRNPNLPEKGSTQIFSGRQTYGNSCSANAFNNDENEYHKSKGCNSLKCDLSAVNAHANEIEFNCQFNENNQLKLSSEIKGKIKNLNTSTARFSPLPSTSYDNETILKNELKFNESIAEDPQANFDCSVIDVSPDQESTVIDNDEDSVDQHKKMNNSENCYTDINLDKVSENIKNEITPNMNSVVDTCNIDTIEYTDNLPPSILRKSNSLIVEKYGTPLSPRIIDEIDLTDIDYIISENESVINKYSKEKKIVTVDLSQQENNLIPDFTSTIPLSNNTDIQNSTPYTKQSNSNLDSIPIPKVKIKIVSEIIELPDNLDRNITDKSTKRKKNKTINEPLLGTCPICLEIISKNNIASTNCGHVFCPPCIKKALKCNPKRCPTCRKKLTGAGYHQLFL